jgi:hypothetical protein
MLVLFDHIACIIARERRTAKRAYQGTRAFRDLAWANKAQATLESDRWTRLVSPFRHLNFTIRNLTRAAPWIMALH